MNSKQQKQSKNRIVGKSMLTMLTEKEIGAVAGGGSRQPYKPQPPRGNPHPHP